MKRIKTHIIRVVLLFADFCRTVIIIHRNIDTEKVLKIRNSQRAFIILKLIINISVRNIWCTICGNAYRISFVLTYKIEIYSHDINS